MGNSLRSSVVGTAHPQSTNSSRSDNSSQPVADDNTRSEIAQLAVQVLISIAGFVAMHYTLKAVARELDPTRDSAEKAATRRKYLDAKLGDKYRRLSTTEMEDEMACTCVTADDIDVSFSSIGGQESIKEQIRDIVVLPLLHPDIFHGSLRHPPKGILLYGPPGTGKTMLAKAVAFETNAVFFNVQGSTIMSPWFGESLHRVRSLFSIARKLSPSIIFIDEIDSFFRERSSSDHHATTEIKAEFMILWDGLLTQHDVCPVIVLGATNRPWDIDPAILRRLPRSFEIPLPDLDQRTAIIRLLLRKETVANNFDYDTVAKITEGYSGSDLKELAKAASLVSVREYFAAHPGHISKSVKPNLPPITVGHFISSLDRVPATGVSAQDYLKEVWAGQRSNAMFSKDVFGDGQHSLRMEPPE